MRQLTLAFVMAIILAISLEAAETQLKKVAVPIDKDGIQRVEINSGEYFFDPNYIVVKVNVPVELKIKKEPTIPSHDFVIEAPEAGISIKADIGNDWKIVKFTPIKPGKYPFFCSKKFLFFKHRDKGMEGVLEVTE